MNMFIDIETTGLIPKGSSWRRDFLKFPKVVSISWKIGEVKHHYIVHDTTYQVPEEATRIHGITTEMVYRSKDMPYKVFSLLASDLNVASKVIGHNVYFDASIIKANMLRYFGESLLGAEIIFGLHKDKRVDTMRIAQKFTRKWVSLTALHRELFGHSYQNAHSADTDVDAVERCYNEMVKRKLI